MRKKRILLLSEGFGSGHTQAAHALAVGIRQLSPLVMTRVIELGSFQHPTMAPLIFKAYRKTITSRPGLYGMLYRSGRHKELGRATKLALHRLFYARTAAIIERLRPEAVVCTHPFPTLVVSRLKRSGLQLPLCTVITDYDAHASWIDEAVDLYLVSTPSVKELLVGKGIPCERIQVTGIPVNPKFWGTGDATAARTELGLLDMPTVLIMGGGWGLIDEEDMLDCALAWKDKVQLLICFGSNVKTMQRFAEDERFDHPHIRLIGYTKDVDKLMEVSDLLLTKPGGMTCTEGMAKGLPMLFSHSIPGQEEENSQYFVDIGIAERMESAEHLERRLRELVERRSELQQDRLLRRMAGSGAFAAGSGPQAILELLK